MGDGTYAPKNSPVQIGTATNWKSVAAGGFHTLAIKTDGSRWAWGWNDYGELGDGTYAPKNSPVQIGTATNWKSVAASYSHSLAIKTDGSLRAWGNNEYGELGDGTFAAKNSPVQIGTATNWQNVTAGTYHTLAIKTDGSLWAWGRNYNGELGDGTNADKNIPTEITPCPVSAVTEIGQTDIRIFPNPTTGLVQLDGVEAERVEVFDLLGRGLRSFEWPGGSVDLSSLPSGILFLKIFADGRMYSARVEKQ
ncbi:MAG: T9SS type A sorting domain-containing protein [Lewinellaceae bacterium]|nr:T9SS type A sorting domain-containing protein [Lewinellaceae bacterium]